MKELMVVGRGPIMPSAEDDIIQSRVHLPRIPITHSFDGLKKNAVVDPDSTRQHFTML